MKKHRMVRQARILSAFAANLAKTAYYSVRAWSWLERVGDWMNW